MRLLEILANDYGTSPEVIDFMGKNLTVSHYAKETLLLSKGQICDCVYFLETGLARGFHDENGLDNTSWFVQNEDFIYSPHSFLRQKPTLESIQLLEDSKLVAIPLPVLNYMYSAFPETNQVVRLITEKYLLIYDQRAYALRHQNNEQLLRGFMNEYPIIFDKAPKRHIASYLGMNAGTLSRLLSAKQK